MIVLVNKGTITTKEHVKIERKILIMVIIRDLDVLEGGCGWNDNYRNKRRGELCSRRSCMCVFISLHLLKHVGMLIPVSTLVFLDY